MPAVDYERAQQLLSGFVGRAMSSIECYEFQLRLSFEEKSEFVTHSPWRLILRGDLLTGSGDSKEKYSGEILRLSGLRVVSTHVSGASQSFRLPQLPKLARHCAIGTEGAPLDATGRSKMNLCT